MLDRHDVIRVRGARVNNLRDVSVDIPKRQLTVFTGVSGSGKSSLVFGTIAAESQRLINETYPAFVQSFMGSPPRPDVDALENLSAAIVVDQERMGANSRSTVGTATDVNALLRLVWSRLSMPHVGPSFHFSFNLPDGMCLQCEGTGKVSTIDEDQLVDRDRSLTEGAITVPNFTPNTWYWRLFAEGGRLDPDKKLRDYSSEEWDWFMYAPATKVRAGGMNTNYEGLVVKVKRLFLDKETESSQKHVKSFVERVATFTSCPACDGLAAQRARARRRRWRARPCPRRCRCRSVTSRTGCTAWSTHVRMPLPARRWSPWPTCWARSSRSVSATCRSTASRAPCPAARRSASRWSATSGPP